jgi:hypothetical protein
VIPPDATLRPTRITLDESTQRVARTKRLRHGIDRDVGAAAVLSPVTSVMPDFSTLHLEADDAKSIDRDNEVRFVVFVVIRHPLPDDYEVVVGELTV